MQGSTPVMNHIARFLPSLLPTCLAAPLAALAIAPPAAAYPFSFQQPRTLNFDHPLPIDSYVHGDARAVVLGQLNEDAIPDACVLHGTEAFLIRSADRRNQWRKLTGAYTGIARLPLGQAGARDAVLALDANGLVRLVWNGTPGVETLVPHAVPATSAWVGATHLQVNETPGGGYEILALEAEGRSLLRANIVPATGNVNSFVSADLSAPATALTALNWSVDGELEYAYAGDWGISFLTSDLELDDQAPNLSEACDRALLVRVPVANELDRLAWIRGPGGLPDFLTVLRPSGNHDLPIYLAGGHIAQATLADLCEDSRAELILFADATPFSIGMRRGSTSTFLDLSQLPVILDLDRAHTMVTPQGTNGFGPGSGVVGGTLKAPIPAAMDLDGDGDDDLFVAGHAGANGNQRAMVYLGTLVDEEATSHSGTSVLRAWLPGFEFTTSPATDEASIYFGIAARPPSGPASTATHLRYTVWVQAQNALCMDLASEQSLTFSLTSGGVPQYPGLILPGLASLASGWVHIESTFLEYSNGVMVRAFPAYHEKIALSWFTGNETLEFFGDSAGLWGPPTGGEDGGVGGTSGRPPSTPPSGGGG